MSDFTNVIERTWNEWEERFDMSDFTIDDVIERLQALRDKHGGDTIVMFANPNGGEYYGVHDVSHCVVMDDEEFPEDWDMPKGFEYVLIQHGLL